MATITNNRGRNASGIDPVVTDFVATGNSATFRPSRGAGLNVHVYGVFVGTVVLERSFDDGANWVQKWPGEVYQITAPRSFSDDEPEAGVLYRLRCSAYTSGTIETRLSA